LEAAVGVALPPTSLMRARAIGQIASLIAGHLGGAASVVESTPVVVQAETARTGCADPNDPACAVGSKQADDVMGYHNADELPNYWRYANNFVLQDEMFEPNASWSLPEHLFMVSEWSAFCFSSCCEVGTPPIAWLTGRPIRRLRVADGQVQENRAKAVCEDCGIGRDGWHFVN